MAKRPTEKQLYVLKNEILKERFTQVTPRDFYRDVFPEGSLGERGNWELRRPNLIFTMVRHEAEKTYARNTIVFDDLQELDETAGAEFAVTSPVTYRGRNRTAKNAHQLWGFCIDLDGVGLDQLEDLLFQIEKKVLPAPTYLINSGHGLHVYYLLDEPVPLYKHLHQPLNDLKHGLTNIVWNAYTSYIDTEERQFQGIFQGFRMPGTQSKLGKRYPVVAFRMGNKTSIETLNDYVGAEYRINDWDEYKLPLAEAKEWYPEWYQRVIVEGDKKRKKWDIAGKVNGDNPYALYDWWLEKIQTGAFDGNRYNCIATLVTYAVKCDMDKEKVLNDALALVPWLNSLTKTSKNEFTEKDVYDAFTYFDESYATYSIKAIEARTKIRIERNKRNRRNQEAHLGRIRAMQQYDDPEGKWRNKDGRPKGAGTAEQKVAAYRAEHPEANVTEVARALGISRPTVYKWWDAVPKSKEPEVHYHTLDGVKRGTFRAGYGGQWESRHIDGLAKDARRHARELASKTRKKDSSEESDNS